MVYSKVPFTYTSGPQVFPTNFALGVLEADHIKVYVDGVVDGLGEPVEYAFTYNAATGDVTVTDALTSGQTGTINRSVPIDTLIADFEAGADVSKRNLVRAVKQTLMAVQEAADSREADSILIRRAVDDITEIADTISDNVAQTSTDRLAAEAAANAATVSQAAAAVSEAAAAVSAATINLPNITGNPLKFLRTTALSDGYTLLSAEEVRSAIGAQPANSLLSAVSDLTPTNVPVSDADAYAAASWTKGASIAVVSDAVVGPNGLADRIASTGLTSRFVLKTVTPTGPVASRTFTFSIPLWTDVGQPTAVRLYLYGDQGTENIASADVMLTTTPTTYSVTTTLPSTAVSTAVVVRFDLTASTTQYLYAGAASLTSVTAGVLVRISPTQAIARRILGTSNQITVSTPTGSDQDFVIAPVLASQAEAQAGTDTNKLMTPARALDQLRANNIHVGGSGAISGLSTVTFSAIPSWVSRLTLLFDDVGQTSGTTAGDLLVQLNGVTTGYSSSSTNFAATRSSTAGFMVINTGASVGMTGRLVMHRHGSLTTRWSADGTFKVTGGAGSALMWADGITLASALTSITLTTVGGSPITFDSGTVRLLLE